MDQRLAGMVGLVVEPFYLELSALREGIFYGRVSKHIYPSAD